MIYLPLYEEFFVSHKMQNMCGCFGGDSKPIPRSLMNADIHQVLLSCGCHKKRCIAMNVFMRDYLTRHFGSNFMTKRSMDVDPQSMFKLAEKLARGQEYKYTFKMNVSPVVESVGLASKNVYDQVSQQSQLSFPLVVQGMPLLEGMKVFCVFFRCPDKSLLETTYFFTATEAAQWVKSLISQYGCENGPCFLRDNMNAEMQALSQAEITNQTKLFVSGHLGSGERFEAGYSFFHNQ